MVTDVAIQLAHERLAEAHDLHVALAARVEVGAALASAHQECREGILEDLLECQELQHAEVDGVPEAEATLVGADRAVHLDPESAIDANDALIVHSGNPKDDHPLRLDHPIHDVCFPELWKSAENGPDGFRNLTHRLVELGLRGVLLDDSLHEFRYHKLKRERRVTHGRPRTLNTNAAKTKIERAPLCRNPRTMEPG
jgi:hypothetical protein